LKLDEGSDWDKHSINSEHGDIDDSKKLHDSNIKKPIDNRSTSPKKDKPYSSILKK